jgi:hypothetical protein
MRSQKSSLFAFNVLPSDERAVASSNPRGAYDMWQQVWIGAAAATAGTYSDPCSGNAPWHCEKRYNEVGIPQNARAACNARRNKCFFRCSPCLRGMDLTTGEVQWCFRGRCKVCIGGCDPEPTPKFRF